MLEGTGKLILRWETKQIGCSSMDGAPGKRLASLNSRQPVLMRCAGTPAPAEPLSSGEQALRPKAHLEGVSLSKWHAERLAKCLIKGKLHQAKQANPSCICYKGKVQY